MRLPPPCAQTSSVQGWPEFFLALSMAWSGFIKAPQLDVGESMLFLSVCFLIIISRENEEKKKSSSCRSSGEMGQWGKGGTTKNSKRPAEGGFLQYFLLSVLCLRDLYRHKHVCKVRPEEPLHVLQRIVHQYYINTVNSMIIASWSFPSHAPDDSQTQPYPYYSREPYTVCSISDGEYWKSQCPLRHLHRSSYMNAKVKQKSCKWKVICHNEDR